MSSNTYERFDKATGNFSAYAILRDGKPVGRIVVKFGAAATAFVQVWGAPISIHRATGYGYDKASAAVMGAILDMSEAPHVDDTEASAAHKALWLTAEAWDGGTRYTTALERAGFTLANVIG